MTFAIAIAPITFSRSATLVTVYAFALARQTSLSRTIAGSAFRTTFTSRTCLHQLQRSLRSLGCSVVTRIWIHRVGYRVIIVIAAGLE